MVRNMLPLDWFLGAAVASLIGGLLLGYKWSQPTDASVVKPLPASLEMMQLLRDEHRLIANMLEIANRDREKAGVRRSEELSLPERSRRRRDRRSPHRGLDWLRWLTSFPALIAPTQPTKSRRPEKWRRDTR